MQNKVKIPCTPLGIIGGMGPIADITFLQLIHLNTIAGGDIGHIPVMYDGNCLRPDRSKHLMGKIKPSPYASIRRSLKMLEREGAGVIVMPCNTAHFWISKLKKAKKRTTKLLDMVYLTCLSAAKKEVTKVCILCTVGSAKRDIYGEHLFRLGIDVIYPPKELQNRINELICGVKSGKMLSLTELEKSLVKITCDAFILGCTELSCALSCTEAPTLNYIDSLSVLASGVLDAYGVLHSPLPYA